MSLPLAFPGKADGAKIYGGRSSINVGQRPLVLIDLQGARSARLRDMTQIAHAHRAPTRQMVENLKRSFSN